MRRSRASLLDVGAVYPADGVTPRGRHAHRTPRASSSNVHPRLLFLSMVGDESLPADFAARIAAYRSGSGTLRMNVAPVVAAGLPPRCPGAVAHQPHHESGIVMAPSLRYMEDAWIDARREGFSAAHRSSRC